MMPAKAESSALARGKTEHRTSSQTSVYHNIQSHARTKDSFFFLCCIFCFCCFFFFFFCARYPFSRSRSIGTCIVQVHRHFYFSRAGSKQYVTPSMLNGLGSK